MEATMRGSAHALMRVPCADARAGIAVHPSSSYRDDLRRGHGHADSQVAREPAELKLHAELLTDGPCYATPLFSQMTSFVLTVNTVVL